MVSESIDSIIKVKAELKCHVITVLPNQNENIEILLQMKLLSY